MSALVDAVLQKWRERALFYSRERDKKWSPMYSIQKNVGRLLEVRAQQSLSLEDIAEFGRQFATFVQGTKIVSCVDMRKLGILAPDVADAFLNNLRRDNPKIERTAFLLDEGTATLKLQMERMIQQAASPSRRIFTSAQPLVHWLSEVLDPHERTRLREFLLVS